MIIFTSLSVFSEESKNQNSQIEPQRQFPTIRQEDFKPYMLGHIYEGCPSNSTCSKSTGILRKKWIDVLKATPDDKTKAAKGLDKFKDVYGIPIGFWIHSLKKEDQDPKHSLVIWDSHCPNHQTKEPEKRIAMGEAMIKNFDQFNSMDLPDHKLMLTKTWTLNKAGKLESFFHPRSEFPIMVDNTGIYFTREEEGKYYGLRIATNGNISVTPIATPQSYPTEVSCPPGLDAVFKTNIQMENLYMGHYCKAVWNSSTKEFQTFVFGWSCN